MLMTLDVLQGSDYASRLLNLFCSGSKRDIHRKIDICQPNIYSSQTKNFPLFWGHTWKYNIQATEEAIKHWILCFCSLFCFLYSTVFFILILNPSLSPISTLPLLSLLHNISLILESLLLFAKHFFYIKTFPT